VCAGALLSIGRPFARPSGISIGISVSTLNSKNRDVARPWSRDGQGKTKVRAECREECAMGA
jgi:hypothetical protein